MAKKAETAKETTKKTEKKAKVYRIVAGGDLNVRKEPKSDAEIVKIAKNGEKIEVLAEKGEFLKVPEGYVMKKYTVEA